MKKEIIEFKNECGFQLPAIIAHYIHIGHKIALSITEKDLAKMRSKLEAEEQEAKKNGQTLIMTVDFQCFIIEQCKKLADLANNRELAQDVNLLIAQNLVPTSALLAEMDFSDIQEEYWNRIVTQYVDSIPDEEEREEFQRLLREGGLEEITERMINDDAIWEPIYDGLEFYVSHLK